jgi:thiamine biosynthesis protein ThiC
MIGWFGTAMLCYVTPKRCVGQSSARLKITQDIRDYAAQQKVVEIGMAEKSREFKERGSEIYVAGD